MRTNGKAHAMGAWKAPIIPLSWQKASLRVAMVTCDWLQCQLRAVAALEVWTTYQRGSLRDRQHKSADCKRRKLGPVRIQHLTLRDHFRPAHPLD